MTIDRKIDARPTKGFFIEFLTKDIPLPATIRDLVDNSVDGARRIRPDGNYSGLWVRIEYSDEGFSIADNCGGIPLDIAQKYAFRFGRPDDAPSFSKSVGRFGVGMKRALFKLGDLFTVESTTESHYFKVAVDVPEWEKREEWDFEFETVEEFTKPPVADKLGTRIEVRQLKSNVLKDFKTNNWGKRLVTQLERDHSEALEEGLSIVVNGEPLAFKNLLLLASNEMQPAFVEERLGPGKQVRVRVYAGLGPSSPREAGWYIICNGRQIMSAEQTEITGWGSASGVFLPKYHNQFARFRGYVLMDADDATLLPWNTTKTSVDPDSDVYRSALSLMAGPMRTVINFLNKLDEEAGSTPKNEKGPLLEKVDAAKLVPLSSIPLNKAFVPPKPTRERKPDLAKVSFDRPRDHVDLLKKRTKTTSNKALGEYLFDYYVANEEIELP